VLHDLRSFGGLLADLRERRGLSQWELEDAAGLGHSVVSRHESGKNGPTRATVARYVAALALDADDTGRLYVAAGLLPPGVWCWCDGWVIRPSKEAPIAQ
jgi:transcriptional regulator with XRE-family HTH domain